MHTYQRNNSTANQADLNKAIGVVKDAVTDCKYELKEQEVSMRVDEQEELNKIAEEAMQKAIAQSIIESKYRQQQEKIEFKDLNSLIENAKRHYYLVKSEELIKDFTHCKNFIYDAIENYNEGLRIYQLANTAENLAALNKVIEKVGYAVSACRILTAEQLAQKEMESKKVKEEKRPGWYLAPGHSIRINGLLDRMNALLGQISRANRRATRSELDQIRGRYDELMDILDQYENVTPKPQGWEQVRQQLGGIEREFNYWAQLTNEPYLPEPRETARQIQRQKQEEMDRIERAMIKQSVEQSIAQRSQSDEELARILQAQENESYVQELLKQKQELATQKQWQFSNQTERMVTILTLVSPGNFQKVIVNPGMDFGPIVINSGEKPEMYLSTLAGSYQLMIDNTNLTLAKEAVQGKEDMGIKFLKPYLFKKQPIFCSSSIQMVM